MIGFNDTAQVMGAEINPRLALEEWNGFSEFLIDRGSLTSSPCREGSVICGEDDSVHQYRSDTRDFRGEYILGEGGAGGLVVSD